MKCIAIFLILIALTAVVVDSKVHRHAKAHKSHKAHKRSHLSASPNASSKFFQFAAGSLSVLSGQEDFIDGCLAKLPGWQASEAQEAASAAGVEKTVSPADASTWTTILGYLGVGINVACMFKDKIMGLIRGKTRKFLRRNRRLFLQGKKLKKWTWGGLFDSVVSAVSGVWDNITKTFRKGYQYTIDGVNWMVAKGTQLTNYVTNVLKTIMTPMLTAIENLKQKLVMWLTQSPQMVKYRELVNCLINLNTLKAIKGLYDALMGFISTVTALATPAGWVDLLLNLICGWASLKSAIEAFKSAWGQGNVLLKFNSYGKALGFMLNAIIGG